MHALAVCCKAWERAAAGGRMGWGDGGGRGGGGMGGEPLHCQQGVGRPERGAKRKIGLCSILRKLGNE